MVYANSRRAMNFMQLESPPACKGGKTCELIITRSICMLDLKLTFRHFKRLFLILGERLFVS